MHFVGESSPVKAPFRSDIIFLVLFIGLVFLSGACSQEEPEEFKVPKIVKPIKKPAQKPAAVAKAKKETPKRVSLAGGKNPLLKEKTDQPTKSKQPTKKVKKEKRENYYSVRRGDTLFRIAGRQDVYGDPMKWPSLFRLNMDRLVEMGISQDFQDKSLPAGLDLRFVTSREAAQNVAKLGKKLWVVNVLSSQSSKKIVPAAVKLMKAGYRVYITKITVKGKEWLRLRAGFFKDRSEVNAAAKRIMSIVKSDDAWVAKIGKMEREKFAGY